MVKTNRQTNKNQKRTVLCTTVAKKWIQQLPIRYLNTFGLLYLNAYCVIAKFRSINYKSKVLIMLYLFVLVSRYNQPGNTN